MTSCNLWEWFDPAALPLADLLLGQQRGPGMYLNWIKLIPVLGIYMLWVHTNHWVDEDTRYLKSQRIEFWNSVVFVGGLVGLGLFWLIPDPVAMTAGARWGLFVVKFVVLLICFLGPTIWYITARNQMVPADEAVTFRTILAAALRKVGIHIGTAEVEEERIGPPLRFIGKSITQTQEDPERVRAAEQSAGYMAAKELVYDAILRRSTDIHLEPKKDQLSVRYRIDGILMSAEPFDRVTGDAVTNVFKVLAAMDIAEKRKPQDGSFAAELEGRHIDFRSASQGTMEGEKLSIRILDKSATVTRLADLGMRDKIVEEVRGLVTQPHGMIIVCGPTGAGKSTSLYAALREIDRFTKNIITIEDPIEYRLDNITQIEINTRAGQTFASSLRSVLRQDPDVLMIGEIRDQETAQIACQAATTGHIVFTTLHANDAVTALFRLIDLGIEPFMVSSALTAIIAQRLVRKLCDNCKEPYKPKPEFLKKANLPSAKIEFFYRPPKYPENPEQVCQHCGGGGYFGRTGIFEILTINDKIREQLKESPSMTAIKAEARKAGMIYLQEDGLRQVIRGATSVQELMRVIQ
jgi:type II secretory ATPase GspE/PulE/Tfp pilus assembly ATPase PilB-like protein